VSKHTWRSLRACGALILFAMTAVALPAQTFTTLYSFCSQTNCTDGFVPVAGLIQGTDGKFYGTTEYGGASNACWSGNHAVGCGTVFEITPNGALTTYSFNGADGAYPYAGLAEGTDGNFYGTTSFGGANGHFGTVFKITASGMLTTLHSFDGTDGEAPAAGPVQATSLDGNFYGTTTSGGAYGAGTLFKITPGGTLTTLYSFDGKDGEWPYAGLVQATDGNFYGTTAFGGADGGGTVFKITPRSLLN